MMNHLDPQLHPTPPERTGLEGLHQMLIQVHRAHTRPNILFVAVRLEFGIYVLPIDVVRQPVPTWAQIEQDLETIVQELGTKAQQVFAVAFSTQARAYAAGIPVQNARGDVQILHANTLALTYRDRLPHHHIQLEPDGQQDQDKDGEGIVPAAPDSARALAPERQAATGHYRVAVTVLDLGDQAGPSQAPVVLDLVRDVDVPVLIARRAMELLGLLAQDLDGIRLPQ
ncbi:hypothetical protein KIH74_34795 [Kineosporia sp. J2-2]|uniref:CheW-like domain-containing protein n=1 Tax=Kineosporia corallincola TaxID=2835133 RepID=A0ABS5TTM3_9ACTN|nr:hypothetical protein [Kineosporia corallincola]MBT0774166.1 hypothetical protein [Kineosporia corallincola]